MIINCDEIRPNTSMGIHNQSNKFEDLFPNEDLLNENKEEEIKLSEEKMEKNENNRGLELAIIKEENIEDTGIESDKLQQEEEIYVEKKEEIKEIIKLNEPNKENITNNKNSKDNNINKKNTKKNETLPSYKIKDRLISQVEYMPKSNKNLKSNKNVLKVFLLSF